MNNLKTIDYIANRWFASLDEEQKRDSINSCPNTRGKKIKALSKQDILDIFHYFHN